MVEIEIDGLSVGEHRQLHPKRWTAKARAWPEFWYSFGIIPAIIAINFLFDTSWDQRDTGFCLAWVIRGFFVAVDPVPTGFHVTWLLDQEGRWQKIRKKLRGN